MEIHTSKLTDSVVTALMPKAKEYEVHDTLRDGLRLRVNPGGTKSWTLFYHRDGRNRRLGLGRYPFVSLARARERAAEALGRIKGPERADPAQEIAVQRTAPTFGELAALFLEGQHFATRAQKTQRSSAGSSKVTSFQNGRVGGYPRPIDRRSSAGGTESSRKVERTWRTGAANTCS